MTVYLADAEGYTYAEIARITGVPLGTVMSRLHRGRKRLRAKLADTWRPGRPGRPATPGQRSRAVRRRPRGGRTALPRGPVRGRR
jgi:RNA polymerase sigma-70 factor, ECF subfamily